MTEVKRANLNLVVPLLRADDVAYFVVPTVSENRTRIGVPSTVRDEFFGRLVQTYRGQAVYVDVHGVNWTRRSVLVGELSSLGMPREEVQLVRVYRFYAWPQNAFAAGSLHAAEVEFWAGSDDGLVAPFRNRVSGLIPTEYAATATVTINGDPHPTLEPFADQAHVDLLSFPVDLVFPLPGHGAPGDRPGLRRALRSLWMHAEGFRRIYVVVEDEPPSWLNTEHPHVVMVSAADLPGGDLDPRLSVNEIDDLSERYVLADDRVYVRRPFRPSDCFQSNGLSNVLTGGELLLPPAIGGSVPPAVEAVATGERLFALQAGGRLLNRNVAVVHPLIREAVRELRELAKDAAADETAPLGPFDAIYLAFGTGRAVPRSFAHASIDPAQINVRRQIRRAAAATTFSLLPRAAEIPEVHDAVDRWYPVAGPYERSEDSERTFSH